jgi:hypothetical protein
MSSKEPHMHLHTSLFAVYGTLLHLPFPLHGVLYLCAVLSGHFPWWRKIRIV